MKKLAIIGGGYMARIYSQNAHEMQIETHAFSLKSGVVDEKAFDYVHDVNILDKDAVLALCKQTGVDGVVATTELTIATAAYVAVKMGLVSIPYEIAEVITDKYRNRQVSKNVEGLNHPRFCEVTSCQEILDLDYSYPIVLKPTSKGGKRGVVVVNSKDEVEKAFEYTLQDSGNALPFIVEEFITAEMECSVESLSYHGRNSPDHREDYIWSSSLRRIGSSSACSFTGRNAPENSESAGSWINCNWY